jgi:hypothetical protein
MMDRRMVVVGVDHLEAGLGAASMLREKEREKGQRERERRGRRSRSSRAERGASRGSASEMERTTSVATPAHISFRRLAGSAGDDKGGGSGGGTLPLLVTLMAAGGGSCVSFVFMGAGGGSGANGDGEEDERPLRLSDARLLRPFLLDTRRSISTVQARSADTKVVG